MVHHYESGWSHDESTHWHACTDSGYEHLKSGEASHTFNDVVTPASYSAGGYTTHTCTVCGYSYTDSQTDRLTYSITWKNWDNSVLRVDQCYEGSTPSYGSTPTRNNDDEHYYVFTGWSPNVVAAYSDATYVAQYSQHERTIFTVSYNSNGGDVTPSSQTKTKGQPLTITSTKPTKEGHTFVGWNNIYENSVYSSGSSFNLDRDVTLWAMWEDTCEHCNGTGIYSWTSTCSFCNGTGKRDQCNSCGSYSIKTVIINGVGGIKQCNNCNGVSISTKTCTWCSGKGSSSGSENCTYCNHTGHYGGDAPTTSSIEARRITLNTISGFEYSLDKSNWQSSPIFDSLKPSTSYTFYQRRATNGSIPFGETSKPLSATTSSSTLFYVTYVLNGGTNDSRNPTQYYSNQSNVSLYNPTREHYTFANWSYNGSAVTQINASWATDIELVANWNAYGYSITYNLDGGTNNSANPSTHGIESGAISLAQPTKNGYTFIGWTGSNGNTPELDVTIPAGSTDNLTYNANWSLNTYTIDYQMNGGINNPSNPVTYTVLDNTIVLATPTRDHYDFKGWKDGNSTITRIYPSNARNYTLTATWSAHNYSITYNLDGGTNNSANPSTHGIESGAISLAQPTKNGYTFIGWTGSNGNTPELDVTIPAGSTDNLTYNANWSLNTYTITYVLYGGTNAAKNPSSYTTEDTIVLKDASKDYYTFEGWYKDSNFTDKVETLNGQFGDLVLYAKFTPYSYSSSFNANGGSFTHTLTLKTYSNNSYTYQVKTGENINRYLTNISRSNYIFTGWYFENGEPLPDNYVITSDLVLTAKWTYHSKITYGSAISINNSGSSTTKEFAIPANYNGDLTYTASITYYTSVEASKCANAYVRIQDLTTEETVLDCSKPYGYYSMTDNFSGELHLTPGHAYKLTAFATKSSSGGYVSKASVNISAPTLKDFGVSVSDSMYGITQEYAANSNVPNNLSREGYDFVGWYDENDNLITDTWNYTSNQEFHAGWAAHNYSINYNLNGGINNPNNPSTYNINDTVVLQEPSREGYHFKGWYTDSSLTKRIETINGSDLKDYSLYASWEANSYSVTLDYGGGQNCPTVNFYSNGAIIQTNVLYDGTSLNYFVPQSPSANLKFGGWYTDSNFTNLYSFSGSVTQDLNLYAKWVDIGNYSYVDLGATSENIDINGKEVNYVTFISPISQTITITSSSDLDLYGEIYDENWNLVASNDDISDDNLNFSITITVEAGKQYFVACRGNQVSTTGSCTISFTGTNSVSSFITGEQTIVTTMTVLYDSSFYLPTPKKEGYVFVGWFDENGNQIDPTSWNYTEDITIYAHWIPVN